MPDLTEEIISMDEGLNWADKLCRCNACGKIERCTIWSDFYLLAFRPEDKHLYCEVCLLKEAKKDGVL